MNADASRADRVRREIASLREKIAKESQKEADASAKAVKARQQATSARSPSTAQSKLREADREQKKLVQAQKKRVTFEKQVAQKTKELGKLESRLSDRQAQAVREVERQVRQRDQESRAGVIRNLETLGAAPQSPAGDVAYDFFISYASPERDVVARPLFELLTARGCAVWFDAKEISVGDSIRKQIDCGLTLSRYGIVILSRSFLEGRVWTERELNGLFVREEEAGGEARILPIWHDVTKEEVASYSPMLADKHALKTADYTNEEIADLLAERLGST